MNKLFLLFICIGLVGIHFQPANGQQTDESSGIGAVPIPYPNQKSLLDQQTGESSNITKTEELLEVWKTINQLIAEAERSYNNLAIESTVDPKTLEDFQQIIGGNGLLMAYHFFTYTLSDETLLDKYNKLVQFAASHDPIQAESVEVTKQIYMEIKKFNEEWQTSFPTKEAVLKKWEDASKENQ